MDTGLLIDILAWFTTDLNTAAAHTQTDLHARYGGQSADRLDALLRACQTHYLLVDTTGGDGRLAFRLAARSLFAADSKAIPAFDGGRPPAPIARSKNAPGNGRPSSRVRRCRVGFSDRPRSTARNPSSSPTTWA